MSATAEKLITVEAPAPSPAPIELAPDPPGKRAARLPRARSWAMRLPSGGSSPIAIVLTGALLAATAGGGGILDGRIAFDLQARAAAVHQGWAAMRADGIPDSELAILEQEWIYSQKIKFLGVGTVFWWPGASGIVDRWQSQSAAIYSRDLAQYLSLIHI